MKPASLFRQHMEDYERNYLLAALECHGWNRTQTAKVLGLSYRTINYKIERLNLSPPQREFAESA